MISMSHTPIVMKLFLTWTISNTTEHLVLFKNTYTNMRIQENNYRTNEDKHINSAGDTNHA